MKKYHIVKNVRVLNGVLALSIDGAPVQVSLRKLSARLAKASFADVNVFMVSPSGYGIRWPRLDEDISIDGLLGISHAPSRSLARV